MAEETLATVQVPLLWVGVDDLPVHTANQFAAMLDNDSAQGFLYLGTATPPLIFGETVAVQMQAMKNVGYIPVKPLVRVALTRSRLRELQQVLAVLSDRWDAVPPLTPEEKPS